MAVTTPGEDPIALFRQGHRKVTTGVSPMGDEPDEPAKAQALPGGAAAPPPWTPNPNDLFRESWRRAKFGRRLPNDL